MCKLAVIYWSGTGNTEMMANAIAEGCTAAGGEATLLTPDAVSADTVAQYDVFAFGCPSMGAEVLEEGEFEPMFCTVEDALSGKNVALFGSYGWGDGQWMRDWSERCQGVGAVLHSEEGLMANNTPDDDALEACRALGGALAAL